jgi:hypothetical protein
MLFLQCVRAVNPLYGVGQVAVVRKLFANIPLPEIEVFESPPENYRMRCAGAP